MPESSHKLAFVIPTMNRPGPLRRLLRSLEAQTVRPHQLILVDAGQEPVDDVIGEFPALRIGYRRVLPPSLSKQRNVGMAAVDPAMTLAGYLDDDLVFEPDAMETMLRFWEAAAPDVGGANFHITNPEERRLRWPLAFFGLETAERGKLLPSGFQTPLWPITEAARQRQWLCGGATVWRREVIERFRYDEWYLGTGYLEDIDYSYRVSKAYGLFVVPGARVWHDFQPIATDRNELMGVWEVINRLYFVKKHPEFSLARCYWALTGRFLLNLGMGLRRADRGYLLRARGNLTGFARAFAGRFDTVGGTVK